MRVLNFILSHSIFVAFCAVALAYQILLLHHLSGSVFLYGFIFFSTLCSYNAYWILAKYSSGKSFGFRGFISDDWTGLSLLAISGAGLIICFLKGGMTIALVAPAVLLTILYALPLLPFRFLHFARRAGVLKTVFLAFTWTYVTAYIPMKLTFPHLDNIVLYIFTRRFLFLLMLCIIFDNRDIAVDKVRGFRSLATDLSLTTVKFIIITIFCIFFSTNFLLPYYGLSIRQVIAFQVSTIALLVTYYFSTRKQGYFFYYFIVDGMMLFSALATYIASI